MQAVKNLFPQALQSMGGQIHVLINCAGIQKRAKCLEFAEDMWDEVIYIM
jgi:2-deoxy-D-gluconate 3-dehydrogenase